MVIFGGMGSILGGFLGAIFVEAILFFWKSSSSLEQFLTGAGLLGILYIYPAGLGGFIYKIRDAVIKIFVPKEILEPDKVSDDSGPSTVIPGPAHDAVVRLNALEEQYCLDKNSSQEPTQNRTHSTENYHRKHCKVLCRVETACGNLTQRQCVKATS